MHAAPGSASIAGMATATPLASDTFTGRRTSQLRNSSAMESGSISSWTPSTVNEQLRARISQRTEQALRAPDDAEVDDLRRCPFDGRYLVMLPPPTR